MKSRYSLLALSLGFAATTHGAVIVGMNSINFTGTAAEEGVFTLNDESNLIDGSGLSGPVTVANVASVTHAGVADNNAWATIDPAPGGGDFFVDGAGATVVFEIFLDNTYTITDFVNWTYGFGSVNDNNVSAITFDYGVGDFAASTGSVAIAEGAGVGASVITSLGGITADRIRLTVDDNHFVPVGGDGGDRVGLTEVRFVGDVVPEPSSVALLGLGCLGLFARRRR